MAETTNGIFPDLLIAYDIRGLEDFATEIMMSRSGREQRRGRFTTQYRRWTASSDPMTRPDRLAIRSFLRGQKGRLSAFYFWNPWPELQMDAPCGSVAAASRFIIPFRMTNPSGLVIPTVTGAPNITDVRVAGVSNIGFTSRHLLPRTGTYAAPRFDGVSGYINCGSAAMLKATGFLTYAAWVYRVGATQMVICADNNGVTSGTSLRLDTSGFPIFYICNGAASSVTCNTAVPVETWTHVAVVLSSGTPDLVTFYINGVQKNSAGIAAQTTATLNFFIGADPSLALWWNGMLSDVRMYDVPLAAGEILNIYNGAASASANLRGWWKLTDGTGTSALDSSGYGNTGTLLGTTPPTWVSGEEEITFTGGNQTGAVTVWGELRERCIARSDIDSISYSALMSAVPEYEIFQLALKEVL